MRNKIVPVLKCGNMQESLSFYTRVLDFEMEPGSTAESPVIELNRGKAGIQLSVLEGDGAFGSAVNIVTENVDELFKKFMARGLDPSHKKDSPVHQGPLNQTWGTREFYVDDPDGNTLRFITPLKERSNK